jgi:prepilin-type N-terminal cleavage/methylation domain-containing protein
MPRVARPPAPATHGFTLPEVMLAIVVLTVGVMALVGSSAMATRMIGRGGRATTVASLARSRAADLRRVAAATAPRCSRLADGSAVSTDAVTERWTVLGAAGDAARDIRLTLAYRAPTGARTDTVMLSLDCR